MTRRNRDEFTEKTKLQLAKRAGWLCCDPSCRRPTVGSNSDGNGEMMLGIAAHICAAAPDGPRYDPDQTPEQRRSVDNGLWLCRLHGTAIDARDSKFTVELLHQWKVQALQESWRRVMYDGSSRDPIAQSAASSSLNARLRSAAAADLDVFRRSGKWPSSPIALTLQIDGLKDPISTRKLATALSALDDLILVAPPGMGKTTTLFQIAEALEGNDDAVPIVVPLGDWCADGDTIIASVLKRAAFRGISESELRARAAMAGVTLLMDGWNELDAIARHRTTTEVTRLQAELPKLNLMISTRKQELDVPIQGTRVNLLPLDETQQLDIAKALRGDAGVKLIDRAWRTPGVRDLVTIPLYLTTLLSLPEGEPFPVTKEEVLRRFVGAHKLDTQRADVLAHTTRGLHQHFLEGLAVTSTRAANSTISEAAARRSVSRSCDELIAEGQIAGRLDPKDVLETLVNHHVLVRGSNGSGYSFQHQQFEEWYASHFAEHLMLEVTSEGNLSAKLRAEVLNLPAWEEAILFACERLARGDHMQQGACSNAILAAFDVDPNLAAEMIYRATDAVWMRIGSQVQKLVRAWHHPGRVDRAVRFMISSGRPEFLDLVWPLITHENDQVNLVALRAGSRFRPSLLGYDAAQRIAALPQGVRSNVLHEIAANSGMDGLDLATSIAKDDPSPEVKALVAHALAFRRADRHVAEILRAADEKTFDLVARKGLVDYLTDEKVQTGLEAARDRQRKAGTSVHDRLRAIVHPPNNDDMSAELTSLVAEMEIDKKPDAEVGLLYEASNRYAYAIAQGLLQRVRSGRTLFYRAENLLTSVGLVLEDDALLEIALSDAGRSDDRVAAAAAVLGPLAVGRMIDALLDARQRVRDASGRYDKAAGDRYGGLSDRIRHTPGASLIAAIRARSAQAGTEEITALVELIVRHPTGANDRGKPFDADALSAIRAFAEVWGSRMLAAGDAVTRGQLAVVAGLAKVAPSISLLPLLKRMLDNNLRRFRVFYNEVRTLGWREGRAMNEARQPHTHEYQGAFRAIRAPETCALLRTYLPDEHFGPLAAEVLLSQWLATHEPVDPKNFLGRVDFSRVVDKRAARLTDPASTSAEADAIFDALEPLIVDSATEDQRKHAVALGVVAARLPHGERASTIQKLISLAPRRSRVNLLRNLVLSGESIDTEVVRSGISEVFEEAKSQRWIIDEGAHEPREWLQLLPFSNRPAEAFSIVQDLPAAVRSPDFLQEMITALGDAPGDKAEDLLFRFAEADPQFYTDHAWLAAVMRRGTASAALRLVDLVAGGAFERNGSDRWHLAREIAGLTGEFPELRSHIYGLLQCGAPTKGLALLAEAIAENPDADGLLLLVKIETEYKQSFHSWRTIENVVTDQIPSEAWQGAYEVVPVSAHDLRRKLFGMVTDGTRADAAAQCLIQIDNIRDRHGLPETEPRHPDLASGKPWPIITQSKVAVEIV